MVGSEKRIPHFRWNGFKTDDNTRKSRMSHVRLGGRHRFGCPGSGGDVSWIGLCPSPSRFPVRNDDKTTNRAKGIP